MQTSKLFKAISTSQTRYMREYNSTGFAYTHTLKTELGKGLLKDWPNRPRHNELIAKTGNLFEQTNSSCLSNAPNFSRVPTTAIVPNLFTWNWTLGAKLKF